MHVFSERIRAAIASASGLAPEAIKLESPRDPALGDVAFPCFALSKQLRSAPPAIAADLAAKIASSIPSVSVSASGPYVNFKIERAALARAVFGEIEAKGARYGGSDEGRG